MDVEQKLQLQGAWTIHGTLGDDPVDGTLRLYGGTEPRGFLDWGTDRSPIRIAVVDRHGEQRRMYGAGHHGLMVMWLEPAGAGWEGHWNYLGRDGRIEIAGSDPEKSSTLSAGSAGTLARARRGRERKPAETLMNQGRSAAGDGPVEDAIRDRGQALYPWPRAASRSSASRSRTKRSSTGISKARASRTASSNEGM